MMSRPFFASSPDGVMPDLASLKSAGAPWLRGEPSLIAVSGESLGFGRGPSLQGVRVRRVVPRPAPTRGRGTSMYHSNANPLQRRPSRRGDLRFGGTCRSRDRRSHGHPSGERRGGAGIGRKQAMDGLRSPVGARDGATRRCARSPHCRGSPEARALRRLSTWPDQPAPPGGRAKPGSAAVPGLRRPLIRRLAVAMVPVQALERPCPARLPLS